MQQTFSIIAIRSRFTVIIAPFPIVITAVSIVFCIAVTIIWTTRSITVTIAVAVSIPVSLAVSITTIIVPITSIVLSRRVVTSAATWRWGATAARWSAITTTRAIAAGIKAPGCRRRGASPLPID